MRGTVTGAVLLTRAGTYGALAFGSGGSSGEGDGDLRQQLRNPGHIEPSHSVDRDGYRRDRGAAYEAHRRGCPMDREWGWKDR